MSYPDAPITTHSVTQGEYLKLMTEADIPRAAALELLEALDVRERRWLDALNTVMFGEFIGFKRKAAFEARGSYPTTADVLAAWREYATKGGKP